MPAGTLARMLDILGGAFSALLDIDFVASLATRSATVHLSGPGSGRAARELLADPSPAWPGRVVRAQVETVDDGLRVSWYRWRRRTPSWSAYTGQLDRELARRYPELTVTVTKGRLPAAMVDERDRP
ncbi:MAG TPA: hypothetical protein DIW82_07375 [Corynebacterium nuruki]|uniref:Uncharacterized protein n=2 Tax=Corynebacterium nuruki TaxID=1032851 RepID=A0A3D4T010_9CORY|nr:hypothetical protein [Corynebacterium nuruki]